MSENEFDVFSEKNAKGGQKSVVLAMRTDPGSDPRLNADRLDEFEGLAEALDYRIAGVIVQEKFPDRKYNLGSGKAEELAVMAAGTRADIVIFYDPLSTGQIYNIAKLCHEAGAKCRVIDRFNLILDIFAERATTHRAKLQVELARLRYELPSAKMLISLSKKDEKAGFGGLGDYEDSYEHDVKRRIARIERELKKADREEDARRAYRHKQGFSVISLAGYTNAGKSTLFNALTDEGVEEKNMLFTTLIPKTRAVSVHDRRILLTDTVGFIEDLPHFMIDAFRSTLEGIFLSDIILLVVDFSEPVEKIRNKLMVCHETLWEKSHAQIITVLNKCETLKERERIEKLEELEYLIADPVFVSAKKKDGLDVLLETVLELLPPYETRTISLPNTGTGASALSWFHENGIVDEVLYGQYITFEFHATADVMAKADAFVRKAGFLRSRTRRITLLLILLSILSRIPLCISLCILSRIPLCISLCILSCILLRIFIV